MHCPIYAHEISVIIYISTLYETMQTQSFMDSHDWYSMLCSLTLNEFLLNFMYHRETPSRFKYFFFFFTLSSFFNFSQKLPFGLGFELLSCMIVLKSFGYYVPDPCHLSNILSNYHLVIQFFY